MLDETILQTLAKVNRETVQGHTTSNIRGNRLLLRGIHKKSIMGVAIMGVAIMGGL